MAKRRPESRLTQENWEDDEEQEEVGVFQKADSSEMKNRVIRVAKRRLQRSADESDSGESVSKTPSAFSGISLLSKTSTTGTDPSKGFSFDGKAKSNAFGLSSQPSFKINKPSGSSNDSKTPTFESKLKELNNAVLECIKGHINSGKLCILSPIFKDYDKYVDEIKKSDGNSISGAIAVNSVETVPTLPFSFSSKPTTTTSTFENKSNTNNIASVAATSPPDAKPKPLFSFGNTAPSFGASSSGFSFTSAVAAQPTVVNSDNKAGDANGTAEEENDEPPKVEFTPVVEESIYSKRCKVFVKDDGAYKDRGTGTLYLKSVEDDKVQLLVRADTNLGNILLNYLLAPGLPAQRMKNNVVMVCIPTPESEPKPKSILIRVKTEDDAEELLGEIKKFV